MPGYNFVLQDGTTIQSRLKCYQCQLVYVSTTNFNRSFDQVGIDVRPVSNMLA